MTATQDKRYSTAIEPMTAFGTPRHHRQPMLEGCEVWSTRFGSIACLVPLIPFKITIIHPYSYTRSIQQNHSYHPGSQACFHLLFAGPHPRTSHSNRHPCLGAQNDSQVLPRLGRHTPQLTFHRPPAEKVSVVMVFGANGGLN